MSTVISFYRFMIDNYIKDDSPIGDLACEMKADEDFPKRSISYTTIYYYLIRKNASHECRDAFDEAWKEYKNWRDQF